MQMEDDSAPKRTRGERSSSDGTTVQPPFKQPGTNLRSQSDGGTPQDTSPLQVGVVRWQQDECGATL